MVESNTCTIIDSTNLHLRDFHLGELLSRELGLPVFAEHDTIAAAIAEKHYGAGRGSKDLIYITVSKGIGAGIIIADEIYRGESGVAGELGHITVERDGLLCSCGKRGCLETVASAPAIIATARRMILQGVQTAMNRRIDTDPDRLTIETIAQAADRQDHVAMEILSTSADYLAMAISTLACILNIKRVIVGGEVARAGSLYMRDLRRFVDKYQLYSNPVEVVPAQLDQDASLKGVCMSTLQRVFGIIP
jgi:glucokinase